MPHSHRSTVSASTAVAVLALLALLAAATPGSAAVDDVERAQPEQPTPWEGPGPDGERFARDLWFVELAGEPTVRGGSPAEQANERARLNAQARQEGVEFTERHDFSSLWNGMSVEADRAAVSALRRLDGVEAVYPVGIVERPDPEQVDPELGTALAMTGADAAGSELGLTGEGLSVAVVDTGIDYNHPDLGGDGDPGRSLTADPDDRTLAHPRIVHGWDYVGDEFDAADPDSPPPEPDPDPMDPQGHGTHVAGIVGADAATSDGATGVAPEVHFGAYKVFGTGSSTADVVVAALEDAYADGMDIVNMSLGASLQWGQDYPTTEASNNLVDDGVAVVTSAGNAAALGAWSLSAPANAHQAISVASADNTFLDTRVFEVAGLDEDVAFLGMTEAPEPPGEGESDPLAWVGRACVDSQGDTLLDDPQGRTALIVRGDCTFAEKYDAAVDAGATGVVIRNNVAGLFAGTIAGAEHAGEVWAAGVNRTDGEALADLAGDSADVVLGFTDATLTAPNPTGGLVSSFSSYGQDLELEFGPSVLAPGGLITSTYPLDQDGYAMLSGTSMAAPHVAGAVALRWEADGSAALDRADRDPLALRDRLQNTAEPAPWSLNPGLGFLDHTFRQGAGMIQIDDAATASQAVSPGQIAVGDGDAPVSTTLTLTNEGGTDVTYTIGHEPAMATGWSTFAPGFPVGVDDDGGLVLLAAGVQAPDEVVVPAGGRVDVDVTIAPPIGSFNVVPNHQFGGYLTLTSPAGEDLRVPYSGFDGDYQQMPLLGFLDEDGALVEQEPRLARLVRDGSLEPVDEGTPFNVRAGRLPAVEVFFGHAPQQVRLVAVEHRTGEEHTVDVVDHHPRSPDPDTRYPLVWDGTVRDGDGSRSPAPSGAYHLRLEALRALGDPGNAEHVETWESPAFRINGTGEPPSRPSHGGRGGPPRP